MKVLITGGAGFIGSHLAERFLAENCSVTVIDDLSTGRIENIAHLLKDSRFRLHVRDVLRQESIAPLIDDSDIVYHLAAAVGVRLIVERQVHSIRTNIQGAEAVMRAAARKKKRVVIASSSEVYGKQVQVPFREDADITLGPTTTSRWSYACAKAMDEFLGLAYWREERVPVTIVRFFNIVGPRQTGNYGMVVPSFVQQATRNEPITVFGSGEQTRCFAYVDEAVECLVRIGKNTTLSGEVINIGNDDEVSINELARMVNEISESTAGIEHIPYQQAYGEGFEDMQRRVPCLQKLEKMIGYRPLMPLDPMIRLLVEQRRSPAKLMWTPPYLCGEGKPILA